MLKKQNENYEEQVKDLIYRESMHGYVSGLIQGALNVLQKLNMDEDEKTDMLIDAVGVSLTITSETIKSIRTEG